ncbi:hypothetical protein JB92DRAFT_2851424 [Gautieria morchelliformis]|nr:hypothetical protein JB92DRAFT_2851424 [Gautieria morchelliformis]
MPERPTMHSYDARCASFTPPLRPKSSSKGIPDLRWPHPASFLATPTSLASAGFYFNPSPTTPDAVSCFICDKGLADWDPEDDPAQIHLQKCPKCPWAMLKCVTPANNNGSLKLPSSRLPSSRVVEKARLATFGPEGKKWWPHDGRNKGPTSKMMAKAGFIYAPVNNKDDTCECIYCGVELAGWEPEDDPMEEHRSRQAKKGPCPFFASSSDISEPTKRTRSRSKPPPMTPIASSSDQEYHPPGTRSSTRPPSSKKPVGSAKSKASAKSSKKYTRVKKTIEEEVVAEYRIALDADEDAPPKPRPKPRRAKSRSRTRASSTQSTVADDTDIDMSSSVSSAPVTTPQPLVEPSHEPEDVPSVSPAVALPLSKSFQSPEDEEFAREEQALEEQARQLMLTDATFSLASSLPHEEKSDIVKSQREVVQDTDPHSAPSVNKGKGKAKASTGEDYMITNADAPPITTPMTPPRAAPIAKPAVSSVVKFPQLLPEDSLTTLTEAERAMTVEQWVRHAMDRQYEQLKSDGRQKIDAFKARAVEVAKQIQSL